MTSALSGRIPMEQKCDQSKARALVRLLQRMDEGEDIKVLAKEAGQILGIVLG